MLKKICLTIVLVWFRYFSYEHFYVIYCKFWELDTDHDFFIEKENVIKYGNHALTYRIVDRIFSQVWSFPLELFSSIDWFFFRLILRPTSFLFSESFPLRFQENLLVTLKGGWDMKILFTSFWLKRINHLNRVLSTGIFNLLVSGDLV